MSEQLTDDGAALRVLAGLRGAADTALPAAPAADPDRWAHLPGNGVGPWRPPMRSRARTRLAGFIKPAVMFGFVGVSLYLALHMFGGMVTGVGSGLKPAVPSPSPTVHLPAHGPKLPAAKKPAVHK